MVYVFPVTTLSNEKNPNELDVAVRIIPPESVIEMVAFRKPRPSDVKTRPSTVASVGVGVGVGVGVAVGVGVGLDGGDGVGVVNATEVQMMVDVIVSPPLSRAVSVIV